MSHDVERNVENVNVPEYKHTSAMHFIEPLSRSEREEFNKLSLEVYGKKYAWQKKLKGQLKDFETQTANGNPITAKRMEYPTVQDVYTEMKKTLHEREEAAKKAQAERVIERAKQQEAELALAKDDQ